MPAPFIKELAGYRKDGELPNTSDANDDGSIELGKAFLDALGVVEGHLGPKDPGSILEARLLSELRSVRPDLVVDGPRQAMVFAQYAHLAVYPAFKKGFKGSTATLSRLQLAVAALPPGPESRAAVRALAAAARALDKDDQVASALKEQMPEESLLKIDITVAEQRHDGPRPHLQVALSSKWSLRTDRAQDCVSQGAKLVAHRRGRMPHFAVITMEPRPSMLKILGDGSGAVDCVYHLDLAALTIAMEAVAAQKRQPWSPMRTFQRLVGQGRLRDYDDLIDEMARVPRTLE